VDLHSVEYHKNYMIYMIAITPAYGNTSTQRRK